MSKKYIIYALVGLLFVTALLGLFFFNQRKKQYDQINPRVGAINEAIYGIGTVMSYERFAFKVAVPKTIQALFVHEGEVAKKGQVLLKFDDGMFVKSPFEGVVLNLPYHVGENVFTDRPVIEIENPSHLYIECVLDQQSSMRVKAGSVARLSFENTENKIFNGKVNALYHSSGQFVARIEVTELPKEILTGMTADVAIEVAQKESALLIPVRAVQMGVVLIEREGRRQKINVKLGIMDQEWAEVLSDNILPNDLVLVKKAL